LIKKIVSRITLTLLLTGMLTLAFNIQPVRSEPATIVVPDDYPTIQEAVNAASPGDTVYVRAGTYYEHVVVNKAVSLIGEDKNATIIDGNETGIVVKIGWTIRRIDHVILSGFTIRRSGNQWIHLPVMVSYPESGIFLREVKESVIGNNIIIDNLGGVTLHRSPSNVVKNNLIMNNEYGVTLSSAGEESVDNVILENTIANNTWGLMYDLNSNLGHTYNNHVYYNNFINNPARSTLATGSPNIWDDGYPSGGNYWSDYNGTDLYSGPYQNETGSDGIGDTPYIIDANNTDNYPLIQPLPSPHDIGMLSVSTSKTVVGQGYGLRITLTIINYGVYTESFNLTAYANITTIYTLTNITLASGNYTTITFAWNTTGWDKGNYTITAYVTPVPGETDTTDNTLIADKEVCATIPGDVDADRDVDIYDVVKITGVYWSQAGDPDYKPNSDINCDGRIDIYDVVICTSHYGQKDT